MKALIPTLLLLAVFAGCARHTATEPSASPSLNSKAACQAAGGEWHAMTHHCDTD